MLLRHSLITEHHPTQNWGVFAAVATKAATYFDTSTAYINGFAIEYDVVYLLMAFPSSWMLCHWGLRKSLIFGALFNAFGLHRVIP